MEETLQKFLTENGAEWGTIAGERVVLHYGDVQVEHGHLTESVALIDLTARGCLAVLGDDRVKFINGQVTNEVAGLRPGQGCYAALVNAKAKMQADLNIYRLQDELILDFEPGLLETVTARLESNLVADQVDLVDASPHFGLLSLQGPKTTDALESVGLKLPDELFAHTQVTQDKLGDWYLMRNDRLGQAGCELYIPTAHLPGAAKRLGKAVAGQGGGLAGWEATEIARIESGIPRFGSDMDGRTLPPEANLESRAISYTKGCYIGQEIIARIRTYGKVNRTLVGYRLDDELAKTATPGTKLVDDTGKAVATITSLAQSPGFGAIAIGLSKRTHSKSGQVLTAETPATGRAKVASPPLW